MQTLVPTRVGTGRRRLALDLDLAVATGLVAALAKKHLGFHLGIPHHPRVGWIALVNNVGFGATGGLAGWGLWRTGRLVTTRLRLRPGRV